MKTKDAIKQVPLLFFLLVGILGTVVISHESYHLIATDGDAKGICFGKCSLGNSYENMTNITWAAGVVSWNLTEAQEEKLDLNKEERNAWIFSAIFTVAMFFLLLYCEANK